MSTTRRFFYPNAALSGPELLKWAEGSASVSSEWLASPESILADTTKNWGRRK